MIQTVVVVNGMRYPVPTQGLRIGRAPENDVVVPDPNVSRQHLMIWATPRGAFLRDLGSQNGTFIGGRRVGSGPEAIPSGAHIRIGVTDIQVEIVQATGPTAPGYSSAASAGGSFGRTGVVLGGIIAVLIVALVGAGTLAIRAVAESRATPTPTSRPVAVSATSTPAPKPTANATATPAPKPTTPPQPTTPPTPPPAPTKPAGGRDPAFVRALNASVRVIVPTGPNTASTGSGTVISPRGHILTNYHVVSDDAGRLINQGTNVTIAVPPNEGEPAQPKYRARVVEFDQKLDLAILQVQALANGQPLPANLGLEPIPIGSSKSVNIGDTIIIIGFPGLGGSSLTVTRGIHSGIARFQDDPGSFIKTDTEINRGNSGGTAINAQGELIGIPTAGRIDREAPGKIGLVRPIDEARPLIEKVGR